jgi:hypothetical protein
MKKSNSAILHCAVLTASLMATNVQATPYGTYIEGVSATTTMGNVFGNISHISDGSGLSALSLSATHVTADTDNSWLANGTSGTIDFDLHGSYELSALTVWNFNGANNTFGVKELQILTSTDGNNFSSLAGAPLLFAMGANNASEAEEGFFFPAVTASYVRFNILSNWGGQYVGLAEVAFDPLPVPEPSVLALLGIGAAALLARRRRRVV